MYAFLSTVCATAAVPRRRVRKRARPPRTPAPAPDLPRQRHARMPSPPRGQIELAHLLAEQPATATKRKERRPRATPTRKEAVDVDDRAFVNDDAADTPLKDVHVYAPRGRKGKEKRARAVDSDSELVHGDEAEAKPNESVLSADDAALRDQVLNLAHSRGALGRGVRACIRALYRRARALDCTRAQPGIYVECGPAYVLATPDTTAEAEHITRYAVEQRAWPRLRQLLAWDETSLHDARARGARLRSLHPGGRYGRHLFFRVGALRALRAAAETLFAGAQAERADLTHAGAESWVGGDVEAIVDLKRMPEPGRRTVAVRCPRASEHANGDRSPSTILWMNADAVTGGAMCPVCTERERGRRKRADGDTHTPAAPPRFLTWRVLYLQGNRAALCTPRRRARPALREMCAPAGGACNVVVDAALLPSTTTRPNGPVGGRVRKHPAATANLAYVTATLKAGAGGPGGPVRARSVGTVARQPGPLQAIMWSDGRERGDAARRRVEETAWYASAALDDERREYALPTRILSVSAMRPAVWRELPAPNGRIVKVPAAWEPEAQAWIVLDLDDITLPAAETDLSNVADRIVRCIRRDIELSGRCAVVQTGPAGLHVWAELREVRNDPRAWFADVHTRTWYEKLGNRALNAAKKAGCQGGKLDMACCAAGRFARRPGWRALKNGDLFRSAILKVVDNVVRGRKPRV